MTRLDLHRPADAIGRAALDGAVFIQPIGATEQHGPHLPTNTDSLIATRAAADIAELAEGIDAVVLPTIEYALSSEHLWAAGTISLSARTFDAVLDEVAESVKRAGAERLVFLNAHGGNTPSLQVACREIRVRHGLLTFLMHPFLPPDRGGTAAHPDEHGHGIHGGFEETSLMLHLYPELVDMEQAATALPEWLERFEHIGFGGLVEFGWTSRDISRTGVIGNPLLATPVDGERLYNAAIANAAASLKELATFTFPNAAERHPC